MLGRAIILLLFLTLIGCATDVVRHYKAAGAGGEFPNLCGGAKSGIRFEPVEGTYVTVSAIPIIGYDVPASEPDDVAKSVSVQMLLDPANNTTFRFETDEFEITYSGTTRKMRAESEGLEAYHPTRYPADTRFKLTEKMPGGPEDIDFFSGKLLHIAEVPESFQLKWPRAFSNSESITLPPVKFTLVIESVMYGLCT